MPLYGRITTFSPKKRKSLKSAKQRKIRQIREDETFDKDTFCLPRQIRSSGRHIVINRGKQRQIAAVESNNNYYFTTILLPRHTQSFLRQNTAKCGNSLLFVINNYYEYYYRQNDAVFIFTANRGISRILVPGYKKVFVCYGDIFPSIYGDMCKMTI